MNLASHTFTSQQTQRGIALHITCAPWRKGFESALAFAQCAFELNVPIKLIFFSGQGAILSQWGHLVTKQNNKLAPTMITQWLDFATKQKITLYVCATDAKRFSASPATYTATTSTHAHDVTVATGSLGQLIDAYSCSLNVIEFKG